MRRTREWTARTGAGLVAALLICLFAPAAGAQSSGIGGLGSMSVPGGAGTKGGADGVKFGSSVMHAGASLELGWDSNVFYQYGNPTTSAILRLVPSLSLGTQAAEELKKAAALVYSVNLALDYTAYLEDLGTTASKQHQVGATLAAKLMYDPGRLVSLEVSENFTRTNEPRAGQDGSYDRDRNALGLEVKFTPARGLLSFILGYQFVADLFEQAALGSSNRLLQTFRFKADWRFFPQTSFWFLASTGYTDYLETFDPANLGSPTGGHRDMVPFRAMVGVTGRFTPRITVDAGIGYGGAYFMGTNASMYHNAVINAGIKVAFTPTIQGGVGYNRDLSDSLVGELFYTDSAYLRVEMAFFERLVVGASFAWTLASYQGLVMENVAGPSCEASGSPNVASCSRKDNWLQLSVSAEWYFRKWLSVGASYDLFGNVSDFDAIYTGDGTSYAVLPGFIKHRVLARVVFYY